LGWSIEYSAAAPRHLEKLGRSIQIEILDYMDNRIATAANPRDFGKALRHDKYGLWRYRVGDFRVICELDDDRRVVVVQAVGHRSTIYE
jgi:mRNA interferase RelE/StbE